MKNSLISFCVVLSVATAIARPVHLALWRGETATIRFPDYASLGEAPKGISVRMGVAQKVDYLTKPFGTHYETAADRVVWGSRAVGPKVVEVAVSADVPAGAYSCGDLELRVVDRVLPPPREWNYFLDLWQHPWAVARMNGLEPFSPAHYAAMRPLWELLASAGQKPLTVSVTDRPWNHQCYDAYRSMVGRTKRADGSWSFDYRVFDEYVAFGLSCGLGRQIHCYTMCPWDYQVFWRDAAGEEKSCKAVPGTPEFKEFWGDFLVDFAAHLKTKGWFDKTYIAMDERSPEDVMNIATFVREKAPGLKLFLAGNRAPSQFKGITLDNCCFALGCLSDELIAEAVARRAKGMTTTFYVCCGPRYPNTFMASENDEAFWLGAYPGAIGIDGFLRWAWNSWPQDPCVDASYSGVGGWLAGDTFLVYPDGSPSLRFLTLRRGIVAAEKMRILKEKGLFKDELAAVCKRFDRKEATRNASDFTAIRRAVEEVVNH